MVEGGRGRIRFRSLTLPDLGHSRDWGGVRFDPGPLIHNQNPWDKDWGYRTLEKLRNPMIGVTKCFNKMLEMEMEMMSFGLYPKY